jgi:hypothetical protein
VRASSFHSSFAPIQVSTIAKGTDRAPISTVTVVVGISCTLNTFFIHPKHILNTCLFSYSKGNLVASFGTKETRALSSTGSTQIVVSHFSFTTKALTLNLKAEFNINR